MLFAKPRVQTEYIIVYDKLHVNFVELLEDNWNHLETWVLESYEILRWRENVQDMAIGE